MENLPWGVLTSAAVPLTIVAYSSLGERNPRWIRTSLNALLLAGAAAFVAGMPLAYLNQTHSVASDGAKVFSMQSPGFIGGIIGGVILAVLALSALAALRIALTATRPAATPTDTGGNISAGFKSQRSGLAVGATLMVTGAALAYFLGGPYVWTPETGYTGRLNYTAGTLALALMVAGFVQVADRFWKAWAGR